MFSEETGISPACITDIVRIWWRTCPDSSLSLERSSFMLILAHFTFESFSEYGDKPVSEIICHDMKNIENLGPRHVMCRQSKPSSIHLSRAWVSFTSKKNHRERACQTISCNFANSSSVPQDKAEKNNCKFWKRTQQKKKKNSEKSCTDCITS